MNLLAIDGLSVRYGDRIALDCVSLSLEPGEILGLVGESGSGKSTIALATIALLPDSAAIEGRIAIDGQEITTLRDRSLDRLRGSTVGMVFQEPLTALNPMRTIGAQVAEAARLHRRLGRRAALDEAQALLDRVGLTHVPSSRYPHQLSGGQRQRVAIAIAIAGEPKLLVADEPTTALDATTQARIIDLLVDLTRERRMGLLLVSHDLGVIGRVADRVVVLEAGAVVETGEAVVTLSAPSEPYTKRLIARAGHLPDRSTRMIGETILDVQVLTCRHRGAANPAVEQASFTVAHGETVGIVGESGSGKTTLLRTILALIPPQAGRVLIDGESIADARGRTLRAIRRKVQAVFQDPYGSFDPRQRVEALVTEPLHLLDTAVGPSERRYRAEAALERVGLAPTDADRFPHQFSGGQRQRIAIARALIVDPSLIVLDEAVSALDVSIRADILDLIANLTDGSGLACLFVSHDLQVMRAIADRVLVMKDGRIVEEGATDCILSEPQHPYTKELVAAASDLGRILAGRYS